MSQVNVEEKENVEELVEVLRQVRSYLTAQILRAADDEEHRAKISELSLLSRRIFDQMTMLEDPDKYIETLNRTARRILEDVEDERKERKRHELLAEARMALATAGEAILLRNEILSVTGASLKRIESLAVKLKRLAGERKTTVENLDQVVEVSAVVLRLVARMLPMAALAI